MGVKILKFFDEDPGSGMETVRIRDGKKSDPASGINIPDPQHCVSGSASQRYGFEDPDPRIKIPVRIRTKNVTDHCLETRQQKTPHTVYLYDLNTKKTESGFVHTSRPKKQDFVKTQHCLNVSSR